MSGFTVAPSSRFWFCVLWRRQVWHSLRNLSSFRWSLNKNLWLLNDNLRLLNNYLRSLLSNDLWLFLNYYLLLNSRLLYNKSLFLSLFNLFLNNPRLWNRLLSLNRFLLYLNNLFLRLRFRNLIYHNYCLILLWFSYRLFHLRDRLCNFRLFWRWSLNNNSFRTFYHQLDFLFNWLKREFIHYNFILINNNNPRSLPNSIVLFNLL